MAFSNALTRNIGRLSFVPQALRPGLISRLFGKVVPFVGTAGLLYESLSSEKVVVSLRNRRPVQNHIKGIHAAAMALLAETASGFVVGMNLPDDKLPLIKSLKVDFLKRTQGSMKAVATLTPEQITLIRTQPKGEVLVETLVTDESNEPPVRCEMLWAWVPKKRSSAASVENKPS